MKNNKKYNWKGITITQLATKYIQKIIKKNNTKKIIIIKIKKSGCAGFKYYIKTINNLKNKKKTDFYLYNNNNIKIYIHNKYMKLIDGLEIDIIYNNINTSIKFNNPKIKEFCGCGNSFYIP